ncbi:MAG: choline TMA-lyase-activating enzyme [Desulfovibrio sp.]|nr:choline TMA-lyase-activating enzyme [Desulfovibrio sp.]
MSTHATAKIFNVQKYSIYDGPGIRTIVFFSGCPLRCLWCSNPEGQRLEPAVRLFQNLCVRCGACVPACPEGLHAMAGEPPRHTVKSAGCTGCGACVQACPEHALAISGEERSIDSLLEEVLEDRVFYETSGGGVTASGGEPLAQWQAVRELFVRCLAEGVPTAMETTGFAEPAVVAELAKVTTLFLYDLKDMNSDRHKAATGVDNVRILDNLAWLLDEGYEVLVRMPLVHGCNTQEGETEARIAFLSRWKDAPNFKGVDLLPYHKLGVQKYEQLGMAYQLDASASVDEAYLARTRDAFEAAGIATNIVRH